MQAAVSAAKAGGAQGGPLDCAGGPADRGAGPPAGDQRQLRDQQRQAVRVPLDGLESRALLVGPLRFTPITEPRRRGLCLMIALDRLLSGVVTLPPKLASPAGFEPAF